MNLEEIMAFLTDNRYVVKHGPYFVFTRKFNKEVLGIEAGLAVDEKAEIKYKFKSNRHVKIAVLKGGQQVDASEVDWIKEFHQFILDAKIQSKGFTQSGTYDINKATKPGRTAFKEILTDQENGLGYDDLLKKVQDYYKSGTAYKVKLENFLVNELWRNDYKQQKGNDATDVFGPTFG